MQAKLSTTVRWAIAAVLVLASIVPASTVEINDNALDLLPRSAVKEDLTLLQRLGLVNRVIITLSDQSAVEKQVDRDTLRTATMAVGKQLSDSPRFANVVYQIPQRDGLRIFQTVRNNLPLLLTSRDLAEVEQAISNEQIRARLEQVFRLLNSPAGIGMKDQVAGDPLGLATGFLQKLKHLKAGYDIEVADGLLLSRDGRHSLIIAESLKQLTDGDAAASINRELETIFSQTLPPGIHPRIIGSLAHTLANAKAVQGDLKVLLPLATLLLFVLLLSVFRSPKAILVFIIPFLAAPPAVAVTALVYGRISALALGFGIVLLGIAVDFSIHIYVGRTENVDETGVPHRLRKPLLLATLTTAAVFTVVLFSEVPSHRQMATLSLSGLLLAIWLSWLLVPTVSTGRLPTLLQWDYSRAKTFARTHRRPLLAGWAILLAAGLACWLTLEYNGNLQTLDAPSPSVIEDEQSFREIWNSGGSNSGFVVASGPQIDSALAANYAVYRQLRRLNVNAFQSIAPLLPSREDQKTNLAGWQAFWQKHHDFRSRFHNIASQMGFSSGAFQPFFERIDAPPAPHSLMEDLPEGVKTIALSMIRAPHAEGSTADNRYLVVTTLPDVATNLTSLLTMAEQRNDVTLLAGKTWQKQVEKSLRKDITLLSTAAAIAVCLITVIAFGSLRASVAVLAPVLSALSAMALFSSLTGKELNMMHLLMGIMVIGLAVDYGIFTVSSSRSDLSPATQLAISVCAMSSLIGFGVLSFASHPALHSLGVTVLVGIGTAWPTALLISPALLEQTEEQQ